MPTTVVGDTIDEVNETFNLVLKTPSAGSILSDASGTATIVDNEGTVVSGPSTFLTINDISVTEGTTGDTPVATFTVTRTGDLNKVSTVKYTTGGGTATGGGNDYSSIAAGTVLSFAVGESSKTITTNVIGDTFPEASETFNVTLSAPSTETNLSDAAGTATIVNDDGEAYLTVNDISVTEGTSGTTAATFTITRSGNTTGASTVKVATSGGTATAGTDYTAVPAGTLVSFAAGQTSKTVTVTVTGDTTVEPNETFNLVFSAAKAAPSPTPRAPPPSSTTTDEHQGEHKSTGHQGLAHTRKRASRHDPGTTLAHLAVMLAEGGECMSDLAVLRNQQGLRVRWPRIRRRGRTVTGMSVDAFAGIEDARADARSRVWAAGTLRPRSRWTSTPHWASRRPGLLTRYRSHGRCTRDTGAPILAQGPGLGRHPRRQRTRCSPG